MLRRPPDGRVGGGGRLMTWAALLLAASCASSIADGHGQYGGGGEAALPLGAVAGEDTNANPWTRAAHQATIQHGSPKLSDDQRPKVDVDKKPKRDANRRPEKIIPDDASALATLAPAPAVRAPIARLGPSTPSAAAGVTLPRHVRDLGDWEVEDFVLLATVDGDLYAADRKTGGKRWHLLSEQPMVETVHHRENSTVLDEDYLPIDRHVWAIEPTRDGTMYIWAPSSSGPMLSNTGLTIKKLVEELAPHASVDPPVAYLGEKKTSIYTLDAATGNILQFLSATGSQTNEASCLQPKALNDQDECAAMGTITLGRTEYTVGVQRRDGRPLATLRYAEWSLNTFDADLLGQYGMPLDSWYITGDHDGSAVAFRNHDDPETGFKLKNQFPSPIAKVFDVCRPRDTNDPNPALVVLPQPPPPPKDVDSANERGNVVFLNRTESGSWYALSGQLYPLVAHADTALLERPEFRNIRDNIESFTADQVAKSLVGTHRLDMVDQDIYYHHQLPALPPSDQLPASPEEKANETTAPHVDDGGEIPPVGGLGNKFRSIPQVASEKLVAFVMNEVWIVVFLILFVIYQDALRRRARHIVKKWSSKVNDAGWFSHSSHGVGEESESDSEDKPATVPTDPKHDAALGVTTTTSGDDAEMNSPQREARVTLADTPDAPGDVTPRPAPRPEADAGRDSSSSSPNPSDAANGAAAESQKKKKAHRGRRGGVKHRKGAAAKREISESRDEEQANATVDDALAKMKKLGEPTNIEPDVQTVKDDMQSVSGPVLRIDNIEVDTEDQLGTGSNGTIVFAGKFDGRDVAVKRMLIQFYDIASQETKLLRESDNHPNVIRYFDQNRRDGFLYIALERCAASLADVVEKPSQYRALADAGRKDLPDVLLQIANGIDHLHSLRIVHRDLKPHNILVNMVNGKARLVVSDFGLCKKLEGGQSSFGATTGRAAGTSGWRAPELLVDDDNNNSGGGAGMPESMHSGSGSVLVNQDLMPNRRATRSIDIFSLGLVFFYVLTNGSHPFDCGDRYMREVNIRQGKFSLEPLDILGEFAYEAKDLISSMLNKIPKNRPTTKDVMAHPFFWDARKRLDFLCDTSDYFEREPRDPPSQALEELESYSTEVICNGDFQKLLPREFVESLGKQRKYTGSKLLDLLRALRNKKNHYEDMSDHLKAITGPLPDGYLLFWTRRFPNLLITCWNVIYQVSVDQSERFKHCYEPARWAP